LRQLGFLDFAGSTVVHSVGGWVALAAVVTVGRRIGRFGPGGRPIEGHDLTLATLGMFILWLGWFGFNGGSNLGVDDRLPNIITNTVLAGVFGGLAGLLTAWLITRRPEVPRILNGIISGLVAITASANIATLGGAAVIGFIAGVIAAAGFALLERLRVDDAIGVIPVHLFAGIWGSLAVALFGDPGAFIAPHGRAHQLLIQMLGVTAAGGFAFGTSFLLLNLINRAMPLRVTPEQERLGLNISEHGATTAVFQLLADMDRQRLAGAFSTPVRVEPYTEAGEIAVMYNHVLEKFNAARADLETALAELRRAEAQAKRSLELIRDELEIARQIQHTMVPPAHSHPSRDGQSRFLPACRPRTRSGATSTTTSGTLTACCGASSAMLPTRASPPPCPWPDASP
jgi:Amt family ammonium transporter